MNKKNWLDFNKVSVLRYLPRFLSRIDKILIGFLSLLILTAFFFIGRNYWLKTTIEQPNYGGTLVEGIVGEAKDFDKNIAALVGAGLTCVSETGEIKGDLAESWEILDDGKTYQFKLRDNFSSQDLAYQISAKNIWPDIEVTTPADNVIAFKFKQPFSPFLYTSTQPIFPYGPYKVAKEEKNRLILSARDDYWRGKPYIEKIVINLYPNQSALDKAIKAHEVMNYASKDLIVANKNFQILSMDLPRELILFFNLSKDGLKNKSLRQTLRDEKPADKDYNFILVTSDNEKNLQIAERLKEQWATLKVNLEIKKYNNIVLQKDIIPKREYDLLLYGIDYGPDPDPYPFWHSSQMDLAKNPSGMNLANFSNLAADKILEQARQTHDFKLREEKYAQFKKILDDETPYILINKEKFNYVVSNHIKGINKIFGFSEADRFLNINQWYIKSKRVKK